MIDYADQLVQAVATRISRRSYLPRPLTPEHRQLLEEFVAGLVPPFDHQVSITIHQAPPGLRYVPFSGPEYFAAFAAPDSLPDQAKAGFLGELFILRAESLGVGTCWYGHYLKGAVYKITGFDPMAGPVIHSITPLGYVSDRVTGLSDRVTKTIWSGKKKTVEENLTPDSLREFPAGIRKGLELACRAPSAMNSQCWYFRVNRAGAGYEVEIGKPQGYRHFKWPYNDIDVGTAAAHFWLGLASEEVSCQVRVEEGKQRVVWKFTV